MRTGPCRRHARTSPDQGLRERAADSGARRDLVRFSAACDRSTLGGVEASTAEATVGVTFRIDGLSEAAAELNVSCANARDILAALDLAPTSGELWGSVPAAELRARAARLLWPERAAMLGSMSERQETIDRQPGRATVVHVARARTYLADRLSRLHEIADRACQVHGDSAEIVFD